ncbi:glycosyltransferase family 2 protein [Aurantiacibacter xanthus]|uniref:Glycosyltransferase family 2 protein n=1 Tax=Aurantiacibacter xanthus TaxID=1784712 RepID=A0A3A1P5J3_9SPHN|nr:glycosyltransferase family 2 protein [Aurantiacibacter xanthus]
MSVISPSYNERDNMRAFTDALASALKGIEWELIVVDDDSPDGTYEEVLKIGAINPRVRCIRRVGRKGLSSAVVEGILASSAPVVAVIDADMQHDETVLPQMLAKIDGGADLVVGTRYAAGGSTGTWGEGRLRMSELATKMSQLLIGNATSDPMSGFFMARRDLVNNHVYDLSQQGYKILLDLIASAPPATRIEEVPYTFRERTEGESKLTLMVLAEFLFLLIEKLTKGLIPPRFVLFAIVGFLGLAVHLSVLNLMGTFQPTFIIAQTVATFVAMVFNFVLNNQFTFRDKRLTGMRMIVGLVVFILVCSVGAIANLSVANFAQQEFGNWNVAGVLGALMGSVFNFGVSSTLVWNRRKKKPRVSA